MKLSQQSLRPILQEIRQWKRQLPIWIRILRQRLVRLRSLSNDEEINVKEYKKI